MCIFDFLQSKFNLPGAKFRGSKACGPLSPKLCCNTERVRTVWPNQYECLDPSYLVSAVQADSVSVTLEVFSWHTLCPIWALFKCHTTEWCIQVKAEQSLSIMFLETCFQQGALIAWCQVSENVGTRSAVRCCKPTTTELSFPAVLLALMFEHGFSWPCSN